MEIVQTMNITETACCAHAVYYYYEKDMWSGDCGVALVSETEP